jgi:hypothetical protein
MKNAVSCVIRTEFIPQQDKHCVSATESNRLMVCKI